jgi:hypothetical protein
MRIRHRLQESMIIPPALSLFLCIILLLLLPAARLAACEFTYTLTGPGQTDTRIIPGIPLQLETDALYSLDVSYREDHRNCLVPPEDTLFLVEEERWKTGKEYLALELMEDIVWIEDEREKQTIIQFETHTPGTWPLQVIRECSRGGYDQTLLFTVR